MRISDWSSDVCSSDLRYQDEYDVAEHGLAQRLRTGGRQVRVVAALHRPGDVVKQQRHDRDHDRGKQEERGDGDGADGGDVDQPLQYTDPEALPGPVADPGDPPFPRPRKGEPQGPPDGDEGDQRVQKGEEI